MEDREGEEEEDDDDDVDSEDEADEKGAGKSFAQLNGTYVRAHVRAHVLTRTGGLSMRDENSKSRVVMMSNVYA